MTPRIKGLRAGTARVRRQIASPAVMFTLAVSTALTAAGVAPFAEAALSARTEAPAHVEVIDQAEFPPAAAAGALE